MKKIAGGTKVSFIQRVFVLTFHVGLTGYISRTRPISHLLKIQPVGFAIGGRL